MATTTTAIRRRVAPSAGGKITARDVKKYRNAEAWTYYDTRLFHSYAAGVANESAAYNFAQCTSPLPFFNARTVGNSGLAFTNMTDNGKTDYDFICKSFAIDVWCSTDAVAALGIATAPAFIESVVNEAVLALSFGTDIKFVAPVLDFPSGGGVVHQTKVRTQAIAGDSDSGQANNGLQSATARAMLQEPVLFKQGKAFTMNLTFMQSVDGVNGTLARIRALSALTGNNQAGIRVKMIGIRGKELLQGTPANA